ncbi:hypothetical protein [Rubritalea tangerina]|uniref:Lipoprotein n=1 Tax=Rubritalea tangerina TaxID=430798 RepID=A0ABW4Z6N5_9BACT
MPKTITFSLLSLIFLNLTACGVWQPAPDLGAVKELHYEVDQNAVVIPAKYGKTYVLEGNVIARYNDFDLARVHSTVVEPGHLEKQAGCYDTYEVRDREGKLLKTLMLTPENTESLLRFRLNERNYFISNTNVSGSVRITLPSHQLAYHHVPTL